MTNRTWLHVHLVSHSLGKYYYYYVIITLSSGAEQKLIQLDEYTYTLWLQLLHGLVNLFYFTEWKRWEPGNWERCREGSVCKEKAILTGQLMQFGIHHICVKSAFKPACAVIL